MHSIPSTLSSIVLLGSAYLHLAAAELALTADSKCGCYLTNGTDISYFKDHHFFDFRSLDQYAGVPETITDADGNTNASPSSDYFTSTDWTDAWSIQNWNNSASGARSDATVLMINTPNNVYIETNPDADADPDVKTWLTMRTERLAEFQTAAELESVATDYQYLSVRMLARTMGSPGAVTAIFTYRDDAQGNVQEADLEVRTMDPANTVQYTNQPSLDDNGDAIAEATQNATLPAGLKWTGWAVHRLDWTPTQSTWYVDGEQTAAISFQVPRDPSQVLLNAWSNGGVWSGNMTVGGAAYMQIQWLDMVFNTTTTTTTTTTTAAKKYRRAAALCSSICSVDETPEIGTPVMLSSAQRALGGASSLARWAPAALALALL